MNGTPNDDAGRASLNREPVGYSSMTYLILTAVVMLAFANGANDNFKGVATLFGSGTTNYRRALIWANVTTLCGSVAAVFFAQQLLKKFSGRGLVSTELASHP